MNRKKTTWIGPLFMLVGFIMSLCYLWLIITQLQPYQWSKTGGRVLSSSIREKTSQSEDGPTTYMFPVIKYQYQVESKEYVSDVYIINYRSASGPLSAKSVDYAPKVVQRYQPGKTIEVFYNPDNPAQAVLERRVQIFVLVPFVIGLVFFGAGFLVYRGQRLDQEFLEKKQQSESLSQSVDE